MKPLIQSSTQATPKNCKCDKNENTCSIIGRQSCSMLKVFRLLKKTGLLQASESAPKDQLAIPEIHHNIDPDHEHSTFFITDTALLIPTLKENGDQDEQIVAGGRYLVKQYNSQPEDQFLSIQNITNPYGLSWWRITTKSQHNIYFGLTANARIMSQTSPGLIERWLPELVTNDKGSVQHYIYIRENTGDDTAALRLQSVRYGNVSPCFPETTSIWEPLLPDKTITFLHEVVIGR